MTKCTNCSCDDHFATTPCDGCNGALFCDLCWKQHNFVHFDDSELRDHDCMCDDCIEKAINEFKQLA